MFIDKFVKELPGNKILEIGVGAGRDIAHFIKRNLAVEGVDYSYEFIDHCKSLYPNLKFKLGDIREIELPKEYYDGIWAFASLLNMPKEDLGLLLPKLRKALRPKGVIFISLKEGEGERMVEDIAGRRLFSFYKIEELQKMVEDSGFKTMYTDKMSDYNLTNKKVDKIKPDWIFLLAQRT